MSTLLLPSRWRTTKTIDARILGRDGHGNLLGGCGRGACPQLLYLTELAGREGPAPASHYSHFTLFIIDFVELFDLLYSLLIISDLLAIVKRWEI